MGTHPIFESDFDCLTECCSPSSTHLPPWPPWCPWFDGHGECDAPVQWQIQHLPAQEGLLRQGQLVAADYMHNSYCMSSSHFNMDNIIVVDGKYRWIPTKMKPPQHGDEAGYSYQEQEQDWTPTDGKGI